MGGGGDNDQNAVLREVARWQWAKVLGGGGGGGGRFDRQLRWGPLPLPRKNQLMLVIIPPDSNRQLNS